MSSSSSLKKWIELGDIIEFTSPERTDLHEQIFFVSYIDKSVLELINIKSIIKILIPLTTHGFGFEDETIQKVKVLSRNSNKGYARQNGLYKNIWVDIFFGGDVPKSITAEITNLEEDMIELTTYPENKLLYIDFAYQGVPKHIPLKQICIRQKPESFHRDLISRLESEENEPIENENIENGENGETQEIPDETYHDRLQKMYRLQELEEEEELPEVIQQIEIRPEQIQFGIDSQVNDLLDAFLSTIPDYKRTPSVMNKIYTHILRFKELREQFSVYDDKYHQIIGVKRADTQPLVNELYNINTSLLWCIPVVSQTKNIYGEYDTEDVNIIDIEIDAKNDTDREKLFFYENNIPDENTVKYANMYIQNASYMCPFTITNENTKNALYTLPKIDKDIDVIVSSEIENNLYSTVAIDQDNITRTKFVMERYNTEIKYPYKKNPKSKEPSLFATLYPSDTFAFRSLFTLPEPFILFSKIKLPNTNILQKSLLHRKYPYYFQYLHKDTPISNKNIFLSYQNQDQNQNSENISFTQFQHFMLSNRDDTAQSLNAEDKLILFLKKAIPTLNMLVNDYLQKQKNKTIYTFLDAVDVLEPFCIYLENMNWQISNKIKSFLYENINNYINTTKSKSKLYKQLFETKYTFELQKYINLLLFLLEEKKEQQKKCIDHYELDNNNDNNNNNNNNIIRTTSEWLQNILIKDQSKLFVLYIRRVDTELHTPEDLLQFDNENETKKENSPCWKRVITKKYYSVSDLRADNNKPVIVDKEYDTTDYSIIETLKKEQPELYNEKKESEFLEFVAENLINKYHYERENAYTTAKNLIAKERMVEEDEYAILENIPKLSPKYDEDTLSEKEKTEIEIETETKKKIMYFIRKKNVWIHVPELDELSFVDNNTLICNIDENCYKTKKQCQDANQTLQQFREMDLEKMRTEFKNRYNISIDEKKQQIEIELTKYEFWIKEHTKLQENEKTNIDYQCYTRGTNAVLQEFVISPYIELRDSILAKNVDFVSRQTYILLFVEKYCREPMIDEPMSEHVHWLYCKETNTKLMPKSLFLLAKGYSENNYVVILERLCNTIGKLSDDGDAFIDKYSGYILKKIEFREEGIEINNNNQQEEGLWENTNTNEITKSFDTIVVNKKHHKKIERVFLNEIDQKIYNIISAICTNIHLENENLKDEMMKLCQEWLQIKALFPDEKFYMKHYYQKIIEKRKQNPKLLMPDDFNTYNQRLYIIIATISILVVIQTTIPGVQIKKSFSRCVKSFYGYPLKEGQDDLTSIRYLVCVLKEMYSQNKEGKLLISKKEAVVENNILEILKKYILVHPHIIHLYDTKRKDMLINQFIYENDENEDKEELNKVENKWQHFLPPIIPFHIPSNEIQSISINNVKQQEVLNVFVVKTRLLSISLIENMRHFINKQNLLFQSKSGFPYLQNACCDEILRYPSISVLEYFKEQDDIIQKTLNIIVKNASFIDNLKEKRKAFVLLKEQIVTTKEDILEKLEKEKEKEKQNIFMTFDQSIYYEILIYYCKLESEIYPIPEDLQEICENKPMKISDDYYNKNMSIIEKMEFLSKHRMKMDANKSIKLMNIVNKRNNVVINTVLDINPIHKFQSAIEEFQLLNKDLDIINRITNQWISSEYTKIPSQKKEIMSFIGRNISKKLNETKLQQIMSVLYNWDNYKMLNTTNILQTMKSILSSFGIIYPSYLCAENTYVLSIPKQWEMTDIDELFLKTQLQDYKNILAEFKNEILFPIFQNIIQRVQPLITMLQYILFDYDNEERKEGKGEKDKGKEEEKKKKYIYEFSIFCLELVFMIYIQLINQKGIYKKITDEILIEKQNEKKEMEILLNVNSQLVVDLKDEMVEEEFDFSNDYLNDVKQKLADCLLAIISTIRTKEQINAKEAYMLTYEDIITKMDYYRDREKQKIKNYFKKMPVDERKPEIELKKLRLGVFSIDNKKLTTYGKDTGFYDSVFDNKNPNQQLEKDMTDLEIYQDLEENENEDNNIYANTQDEDDNLDIQQNEDDYEDINDNIFEDGGDSEYY